MDHVVVMSFLVGVILVALSMLKAGFVTIFISNTVIRAFTTGAAIGVCSVRACLTANQKMG
jgi:MFS superfamily sulfate permease-like transporter